MNRGPVICLSLILVDVLQTIAGEMQSNAGSGTNAPAEVQSRAIRPEMTISITLDEDRSLNRMYTVPGSGAIDYPPLGRIMVGGLMPDAVAQTIKQALEKDYFKAASVHVSISTFPSPARMSCYVIEEAGKTNIYELPMGQALPQAIDDALKNNRARVIKIWIIRQDESGRTYKTRINPGRLQTPRDFDFIGGQAQKPSDR